MMDTKVPVSAEIGWFDTMVDKWIPERCFGSVIRLSVLIPYFDQRTGKNGPKVNPPDDHLRLSDLRDTTEMDAAYSKEDRCNDRPWCREQGTDRL